VSVRKRTWKTDLGEDRSAWVADYTDQLGHRHLKTFEKKKDADAYHAQVAVDVRAGLHVADSRSITVAEAGELWITSREAAGLERATLVNYRRRLDLHIVPLIGATKLSNLSVPFLRSFEDRLRQDRSSIVTRAVMVSLSSILSDAQERGLVAQNVARGLRSRRSGERHKKRLEVGVGIPAPAEISAIIGALPRLADPCWRPLLMTAIFTGLRASEIRGLRWTDVSLDHAEVRVSQRADRYGAIGVLKSAAGSRTIPLPPVVVNTLREWKVRSGGGDGLVFPGAGGEPLTLERIISSAWHPVQVAAGAVDADGAAKYSGFHALRHFYASWCINRKADGGLELPIKTAQSRLGHASIQMTADTYGHLFPRGDDGKELDAASAALMTVPQR
jgi:integrase